MVISFTACLGDAAMFIFPNLYNYFDEHIIITTDGQNKKEMLLLFYYWHIFIRSLITTQSHPSHFLSGLSVYPYMYRLHV